MRILMGIDDSEFSRVVVRAVLTQFQGKDTQVRVLHVLQPISPLPPPQMAQGYAPELEGQREQARQLVQRVATELDKAGFNVESAVEIGDIRETILDVATEWKADLVVIGSHARKGIHRFLLGSVAEFVARHAKCSVEIIRAAESI